MLEWLKLWANQVIVAVIIAVIFELIIPNGKNKKYIKMVINLYVLFVLINPIISKFAKIEEFNLSKYDYEKYINNQVSKQTSSNLNSEELIQNTYEKSIKEDIIKKLEANGYNASNISIHINNSKGENYGQINWIKLSVAKIVESDAIVVLEQNNSSIQINRIENVNINSEEKDKKKALKKSEIEKLKKILAQEYNIPKENIEINEWKGD